MSQKVGVFSSLEHVREPVHSLTPDKFLGEEVQVASLGGFASAPGSLATSAGCVSMFVEGDWSFVKSPLYNPVALLIL